MCADTSPHSSFSVAVALALCASAACGGARGSASPAPGPKAPDATRESSLPAAIRSSYASRDTGNHAIAIFAAATIRELRFASQPQLEIKLRGAVGDSVRIIERRNLPSPIVPGTTYRDVYIAVEILGHLNAQCISALIAGAPAADSAANNAACARLIARDSARQGRP